MIIKKIFENFYVDDYNKTLYMNTDKIDYIVKRGPKHPYEIRLSNRFYHTIMKPSELIKDIIHVYEKSCTYYIPLDKINNYYSHSDPYYVTMFVNNEAVQLNFYVDDINDINKQIKRLINLKYILNQ